MKFRKNWKRFWTLDRHHAEGFTLVELIVVIAILAILAGVGTVGYSGYVKKANMTADQTLVSEIENALILAGYNGTFENGEGGYLILSVDGVAGIEDGSSLDTAMKDAFGANYKESLKLKYNGWESSGLSDGLFGAMAAYVKGSSYMTGNRVDALLGDVEKMTGMAQHLVTSLASGTGLEGTTLSTLFSADVLNATGQKYGIGEDDWTAEDWDAWGAKEENKVAYSNLLVLAAADDIENAKLGGQTSSASNLIMEFSSYYAFAATHPEFSEVLDAKLDELQNVDSVDSGKTWYQALESAAIDAGYDKYRYKTDSSGNDILDEDGNRVLSEQYGIDNVAFATMLSALGNPTDAQSKIIANDLNNANLFTSGVGNTMYNNYMDAVEAVSAIFDSTDMEGITVPAGGIVIMITQTSDGLVVFNSLPTE